MDTISANYLITTKTEYENKLQSVLSKHIILLFKHYYHNAEVLCNEENTPNNILMIFKYSLNKITKWKPIEINKEYNKFIKSCDYFNDLIKIIFITNIKILTLLGHNKEKIQIQLPSGGQILHKIYLSCIKAFENKLKLFRNINLNKDEITKIINNSIYNTIQDFIPVDKIVSSYDIDINNIETYSNIDNYTKEYNKQIKQDLKHIINTSNKPVEEEVKPVEEEVKPIEEKVKPVEEEVKPIEEKEKIKKINIESDIDNLELDLKQVNILKEKDPLYTELSESNIVPLRKPLTNEEKNIYYDLEDIIYDNNYSSESDYSSDEEDTLSEIDVNENNENNENNKTKDINFEISKESDTNNNELNKENSLKESINLDDLIGDIKEINLDIFENENSKPKQSKIIKKQNFTFFEDASEF